MLVIVAAIGMMVALDALVNRTKVGRGIRATAQDPEAAVLMGVDIDEIVTVTFLIGGGMAGVAGALYLISFENTGALHRVPLRDQGVHRGGPGWYRQPAWAPGRRYHAGSGGELRSHLSSAPTGSM